MRLWKNRHGIIEGFKEIGCGLLTVLFISLPVWVFTISWRGPLYAIGSLFVLILVVVGMALLHRYTRKK